MRYRNPELLPVLGLVLGLALSSLLARAPPVSDPALDLPTPRAWHPSTSDVSVEDYRAERVALLESTTQRRLPEVLATVSFANPIEVERAFTLLADSRVDELTFFLEDESGGLAVGTHQLDRPELRELLEPTLAAEPGLLGVAAGVVYADAETLRRLQDQPEVFLVDIGADPAFLPEVPDRRPVQHVAWHLWCDSARATEVTCDDH